MMRAYLLLGLTSLLLLDGVSKANGALIKCTPFYVVTEKPLIIPVGGWDLTFRLLAVGCEENLRGIWPPKQELIERELQAELQEPHPVQMLLLIRDRSPDLRQRITRRINKVIGRQAVQDVFLFDAKAAE